MVRPPMRAAISGRCLTAAALALWLVAGAAPATADLRISELQVFLNDHEVTVNMVLLGAIPAGLHEGLQGGIPAHVRYTVELWQFNRYWRDARLLARTLERQIVYNVVTKEFRVSSLKGETRPPHVTKDLRDAQRVLSEIRALKLTPATALHPSDVIYVRVHAESSLNGENTVLTRMAGTAEQTSAQSDYRTLYRTD
jgi:hypothetical protein